MFSNCSYLDKICYLICDDYKIRNEIKKIFISLTVLVLKKKKN